MQIFIFIIGFRMEVSKIRCWQTSDAGFDFFYVFWGSINQYTHNISQIEGSLWLLELLIKVLQYQGI